MADEVLRGRKSVSGLACCDDAWGGWFQAGCQNHGYGLQIWIRVAGFVLIWAASKNPGRPQQPRTLALPCITSHSLTTRQQHLPLSWRLASEPVSDALAVRRRR